MSCAQPIKVLLVDDHRLVLWGLGKLIETARPQIELADIATCQNEALAAMQKHQPDVVLLDLDLGRESGLDLVPQLARQAAVIILTGLRDAASRERAILAGARGVVHKAEPAAVILKAIVHVHAGELWLDRSAVGKLLHTMSSTRQKGAQAKSAAHSSLTTAERKVLAAVVRHKSAPNKVIAAGLHISEYTLRNHLSAIYGKLGVNGRLALVFHAMEHGVGNLPS
jgi:two-component system nitrate/nitrite response regulator NarL